MGVQISLQDLAFSSFGWAGLLNRKIPGSKCRRNCTYSKPLFLQPWMMNVKWWSSVATKIIRREKFLIGRVTMDESNWCPLNPLVNFNEKREGHTHRHRTNWLLCGYVLWRETQIHRENQWDAMCHLLELTPPRKSVHVSRQVIHRDYGAQRSPLSHTWKAVHQLGSWETLPDKWSHLFNK